MIKIIFVCLGNICRSPMAEFVMKKIVKNAGFENQFEIASAATSNEEFGNPVYPPAKQKLAEHGILCEGKTSRQITKNDYNYYDYIIAMDSSNVKNIKQIVGSDYQNKIKLLMSYTNNPHNVADPWYTGNFDETWTDVYSGCNAMLKKILEQ